MINLPIRKSLLVAIVDDHNFERLSKFLWYFNNNGNVYRAYYGEMDKYGRRKHIFVSLASEVMQRSGVMFDHKDRNPLNNLEINLRETTNSLNGANKGKIEYTSSTYKGVCFRNRKSPWQASIRLNGKLNHIGCFKTEEEAAKAYDAKAIEFFGEFAVLNFR